jgi:hypothetical protein
MDVLRNNYDGDYVTSSVILVAPCHTSPTIPGTHRDVCSFEVAPLQHGDSHLFPSQLQLFVFVLMDSRFSLPVEAV